MKEVFHFRVEQTDNRKRFDEFLFQRLGMVSKMHLRNLLKEGVGKVNHVPEKPGFRLKTDDEIEIKVDLSSETSMKPDSIRLEILFEDNEILVINKPPEMLVHPTLGVKSGTLVNAVSFHLNQRVFEALSDEALKAIPKEQREIEKLRAEIIRPGLIHRLDKQTSGLIVIAKTERAHKILSGHFQRKLVEKKYLALVEGIVQKESGVIHAPIGHDENLRRWCVLENGKASETRFRVLRKNRDTSLLELEPVTGRTNQLRIHCAHLGHSMVGDTARGGREFVRLCLHAYKLSFWHPNGTERLEFEIETPESFDLIDA